MDGAVVAAVERKSLADLVSSLLNGRLRFALAELAALPRAALVVEDRWSGVFKLERVRPATVADAIAEVQVRWPSVPIVFAETRPLAEEWTYRWLAAARAHWRDEAGALARLERLAGAGELPAPEGAAQAAEGAGPAVAQIRAWALSQGLPVRDRGRLRPEILQAYAEAHPGG